MEVSFKINGKCYKVSPATVPLNTSLNSFIRNYANLSGTKFMCLEGFCGVCTVSMKYMHPVTNQETVVAVNSCMQNVYSCHNTEITTVEGVGSTKKGLHKIQKQIVKNHGIQCGYCTPGMVMNMYSLLESKNNRVKMSEVENSFGGNFCRCTGYRPIMDAFKSLAVDGGCSEDIEDADKIKICSKTGAACQEKCGKKDEKLSFEFDDSTKWHRVMEVDEIFKVLDKLKDDEGYMLVAGNIGHEVCKAYKNIKSYIDISAVKALKSFKLTHESLEIGANSTITEAMEIFKQVSQENSNFSYLSKVYDHFDLIANIAIRNVATIAGNLAIKNFHDFQSDIFVVLQALDATIEIATSTDARQVVTMTEFLELNMNKKLITKVLLPSYDPATTKFGSYKIMPRSQNIPAYVNAAFMLQFENQKVTKAYICFGGISATFKRAENLEKFLIGKNIEDNQVITSAIEVLTSEVTPTPTLLPVSTEFRQNLASSLFYKFILSILPDDKVDKKFKSGAKLLDTEISTSSRNFDKHDNSTVLGNPVPNVKGDILSTGEAKFANDMPKMVNELYAAFVTGKKVNGIIKEIDASEALKIPGVTAFYSAKDIPGKNTFMPENFLFVSEPEEIFCSSKILFHNQPVGIILADTFELANEAAKLVVVKFEDDSTDTDHKLILTFDDVKSTPPNLELDTDFSKILENPPNPTEFTSVSGKFFIGSQYHYYMETQTCICIPNEKGMEVYSSTQWMDAVQTVISESINMPRNQINMYVSRLGGGFGGKVSRSTQIGAACAIGAHHTNRPVRLIQTMKDNMSISGLRNPNMNDYEVKFDQNGKILILNHEYIEDFGCSFNEPVTMGATPFTCHLYDSENYNIKAYKGRTNKASFTWCRAPGPLEGVAMIENTMEHIAWKLKKDPVEVRIANLPEGSEMKNQLELFVKECDYYNRLAQIQAFNSSNRWTKRGISIVPVKYPTEYFGIQHALVSIFYRDGSVSVNVGGIEMGQGLVTKVTQTASHALNIPMDKINIKWVNSIASPNATVSGGNITSEASCEAVRRACEILHERLEPVRIEHKIAEWEKLIDKAYELQVDLLAFYMFKPSDLPNYDIWGTTCTEVEVDILTGNIQIPRVDITVDCESVNPAMDIGQMEGGFVMGLGLWLMEKIVHDPKTGELLTNGTWNYINPGVKDIPKDFRVNIRRREGNGERIVSSKAAGEPPLVMSVSILFALRQALNSARIDSGLNDEYFILGGPATGEDRFLIANTKPEMLRLN
ncbi:unnamed protein product [Chironomus riparius]|uniref:Indole-3-acetaldehyde oxidase n=1 Tax=Chironomus riparius TaxID=315576 RepID=A0A9N9SAT1_9DIPT|nr:unnamed protein product [Chironomus riparius]